MAETGCFGRKELWDIRDRADKAASVSGLNPRWKRVYLQLSDAANFLDAIIARTEVYSEPCDADEKSKELDDDEKCDADVDHGKVDPEVDEDPNSNDETCEKSDTKDADES